MAKSKKYLTLEEAAQYLGIAPSELVRARERGDIRGFADRGSWKFRSEDVEDFGRSRTADSDPEVPLLQDPPKSSLGDTTELDAAIDLKLHEKEQRKPPQGAASDSVIVVDGDDQDEVGEQPTVIRRKPVDPDSDDGLAASDSDVRLVTDDRSTAESEAELPIAVNRDSDSDIRLAEERGRIVDAGSDSDVKLVKSDSDSDVALVQSKPPAVNAGSDSDVKLLNPDDDSDSDVKMLKPEPEEDSDSDVTLLQSQKSSDSDSDVKLTDSDSDVKLVDPQGKAGSGAGLISSDSDVRLVAPSDSDSVVIAADEPIRDTGSDSDVHLADSDSGVALAADNGPISDSDVQLMFDDGSAIGFVGDDTASDAGPGSASDIQLVFDEDSPLDGSSDSDVQLVFDDGEAPQRKQTGSDSNVKLVPRSFDEGSDSDVALLSDDSSDSDVALLPDDEHAISLSATDSGHGASVLLDDNELDDLEGRTIAAGSGVLREMPADSGIALESIDSGISLEVDESSGIVLQDGSDSGITAQDSGIMLSDGSSIILEESDSGIALDSGDSGIALDFGVQDSGISLGGDSSITLGAGDSGISLESAESGISLESVDSGIALDEDDINIAGGSGIMVAPPADSGIALEDNDIATSGTVPEFSAVGDDDDLAATQLEVPSLDDDESDFEIAGLDDDNALDDDQQETSVILFDDEEDVDDYSPTVVKKRDEAEAEGFGDDEFDEFDDFEGGDIEDVVGEDDELDEIEDVFDPDDEDFDDSFHSGESHAEFVAPVSPGAAMVHVEREWDTVTFALLVVSTVAMVPCAMIAADLVMSMWAFREPLPINSMLLETFSGLF